MENIEQAFDKAVTQQGQAEAAPQGQAAEAPSEAATQPEGQVEETQETPTAPVEGQAVKEWDGNEETIADALKTDPKSIQRAYTRIGMAKADAEKRLKEYEGKVNLQEWDQYQTWKQQLAQQQLQKTVEQPKLPVQLTQDEWNVVRDNPEYATQYIQSLIKANLEDAATQVASELAAIKKEQAVTQWEKALTDFGTAHPDMWEMHQMGLMKPILEETLKTGGSLEDAYKKAANVRQNLEQAALKKAQVNIGQKKKASSFPGTGNIEPAVVYADDAKSALDKAMALAFEGKKGIKVKVKK